MKSLLHSDCAPDRLEIANPRVGIREYQRAVWRIYERASRERTQQRRVRLVTLSLILLSGCYSSVGYCPCTATAHHAVKRPAPQYVRYYVIGAEEEDGF